MKKVIFMLISVLFIPAVFSACGKENEKQGEADWPDTVVAETTNTNSGSRWMDFDVQYVRTGSSDYSKTKVLTFNSLDDLQEYNNIGTSFDEAVKKYDRAFFEKNMLAVVLQWESSGSFRHQVDSVIWHKDKIEINMKRRLPWMGTDDVAMWHIIIELEKTDIPEDDFIVNLTDFNILEGITIKTQQDVYPRNVKEITVDWRNNTDKEIGYGLYFHLEKKINGVWEKVYGEKEVYFIAIAVMLPPYSQHEEKYDISVYTDKLEPGDYRIAAQLHPDWIYAEFRVE